MGVASLTAIATKSAIARRLNTTAMLSVRVVIE